VKPFFIALFFITSLGLSSWASSVGQDITETFAQKDSVETAIKGYIEGFQKRDYDFMKNYVTPHFVKATGGKKAWIKKFADMPSSSVFNPQNIKIITKNKKVFVQFEAEEKMSHDSWFLIVYKNKKWLLDEPINDFDLE
jgi:hypothetical protein